MSLTRHTIVFVLLVLLGTAFYVLLAGYMPDDSLNRSALYYAENTAVRDRCTEHRRGDHRYLSRARHARRGHGSVPDRRHCRPGAGPVARRPRRSAGHGILPPGELLTTGARILVPMILLFGAYVFINGHLTPGGGFQGGAVLASGAILLLLADPGRRFSHGLISSVESSSGVTYVDHRRHRRRAGRRLPRQPHPAARRPSGRF